jgi:hypothetical protein
MKRAQALRTIEAHQQGMSAMCVHAYAPVIATYVRGVCAPPPPPPGTHKAARAGHPPRSLPLSLR